MGVVMRRTFWVWMLLQGLGRLYTLIIGCVILMAQQNKLPAAFNWIEKIIIVTHV
jgi:hypothetical protein